MSTQSAIGGESMAIVEDNNETTPDQIDPDQLAFRRHCLEKRLMELHREEERIVKTLTSL